ncbi:MAG: PH domain-containing protein [Paraprevotella sp.]|nr:PH domain-containing protein [Paraprevotella sp.]
MTNSFKSSYSKGMLTFTIVLLCIFFYVIYRMCLLLPQYTSNTTGFLAICLSILVIAGVIVYAFTQQIESINITPDNLVIKKKIGKVIIKLDEIQSIRHKKDILRDIKLWGISGLFGHFGWFWNPETGRYFAIANNGNTLIEIRTSNKCYVVSCDRYEEVIQLLKPTE